MSFAAAGLAFFPALAIGSFLNVVAARVPLKRSIVSPPSACMSCGTELSWRDNVPVLSWLLLRGRCRTCKTEISWRYPAVELSTAVLVAACFWKFGLSADAAIASFFCGTLVVLSAIDIDRRIIPNNIVLPAAAIVLVANTVVHPSFEWLAAGFGAALFLLLAALAYPRGMGMGDVKLALLLGAGVGRYVPIALCDALRAPRHGRPQDGDPVRALPRLRRAGGALRRQAPARRVSEPPLGVSALSVPRRRD
jgi:leader peptidase (prepilin peptidase)/N-methyltransferase